jgi:NRPS condensation-like uncharacterized protein
MQFYFRDYNDITMRSALFFDGEIDEELLKKALTAVIESFPIVKARFKEGFFKSRWTIADDSSADGFFEMFETSPSEHTAAVEKYIAGEINPLKTPLFKTAIFRKTEDGKKIDCLVFLMSHMLADGDGFALFMKAVAEAYAAIPANPDYKSRYGMGNRDYKQFYEYLSGDEIKRAKKMTDYRYEKNERLRLPYKAGYDKSFERKILTRRVDGFDAVKKFCKAHGLTFNDVVLAAYFRALKKRLVLKDDESISIDCVLNLRRYMPAGDANFCNLVSKVKVNVGREFGDGFLDTCKIVHEHMAAHKDNLAGLGGLSLLNLMDKAFPFKIGEILIKLFYQNPLIALSNIGKLDKACAKYGNLKVQNLIMTGTVKYAPSTLLSLITYEDSIFFALAEACSAEDFEMLDGLIGDVAAAIGELK